MPTEAWVLMSNDRVWDMGGWGGAAMYSQVPSSELLPGTGEEEGEEPWICGGPADIRPLQASSKLGGAKQALCCRLARFRSSLASPCCKRRTPAWGTGSLPASARGLARAPNADLGITSGARQGVKGDPRGPFTSASSASPARQPWGVF